jgi:hypothetical protein
MSSNRRVRRGRARATWYRQWDLPWYGPGPTAARCEHVPAILDRAARSARSIHWSAEQDSLELAAEILSCGPTVVDRIARMLFQVLSTGVLIAMAPTRGQPRAHVGLVGM